MHVHAHVHFHPALLHLCTTQMHCLVPCSYVEKTGCRQTTCLALRPTDSFNPHEARAARHTDTGNACMHTEATMLVHQQVHCRKVQPARHNCARMEDLVVAKPPVAQHAQLGRGWLMLESGPIFGTTPCTACTLARALNKPLAEPYNMAMQIPAACTSTLEHNMADA